MATQPPVDIPTLLQRIDKLIAEAKIVREDLERVTRERTQQPLWPERRQPSTTRFERRDNERRRRQKVPEL
jgi:hypothetical protein